MKKIFLFTLSMLCSTMISNAQQSEQVKLLEVNEFKKEITKENIILINVRTAEEYDSGHIKDAVNVDFYNQKAFIDFFKNIYDLKGGYLNWVK